MSRCTRSISTFSITSCHCASDLTASIAYAQAVTVAGALVRAGRRSWGPSGRVAVITHVPEGWEVRTVSRGQYDAHKTGRVVAKIKATS